MASREALKFAAWLGRQPRPQPPPQTALDRGDGFKQTPVTGPAAARYAGGPCAGGTRIARDGHARVLNNFTLS